MSEIQIGWEAILPFMFELRLVAFIVGCAIFIHFTMMAGFLPERTSWLTSLIIVANAAAGMGLLVGGVSGDLKVLIFSALASSASMIIMGLWLWHKGFHVSEFLSHESNTPA